MIYGNAGLSRINDTPDKDICDQRVPTQEDVLRVRTKLLKLLAHRCARYTMDDSSSLPTPVVHDLFASICFVLGIDTMDEEAVVIRFMDADIGEEFQKNLKILEHSIEIGNELWQQMLINMSGIENIALKDTLVSIGGFWERYDYQFFAHQIPCDIDYPLCHPISDSLLGIAYINEYLCSLNIEECFLRQFDTARCNRLLAHRYPDYRGLLINVYEPIASNALGLSLIGNDPFALTVSAEHCAEIACLLKPLTKAERSRALRDAAEVLSDSLGIPDFESRDYLRRFATDLLPRIEVALTNGNLGYLFSSFS